MLLYQRVFYGIHTNYNISVTVHNKFGAHCYSTHVYVVSPSLASAQLKDGPHIIRVTDGPTPQERWPLTGRDRLDCPHLPHW